MSEERPECDGCHDQIDGEYFDVGDDEILCKKCFQTIMAMWLFDVTEVSKDE